LNRYSKVDFYYDDLLSIFNYLKLKTDDVVIETDKYLFNDFQEFKENCKTIKTLNISTSKTRIYLRISKSSCVLEGSDFLNENFNDTAEAFHHLDNIIRSCLRNESVFSSKLFGAFYILYFIVIFLDSRYHYFPNGTIIKSITLCVLLAALWNFVEYRIPNGIYTTYKEETGFWKRKKDDIYLAIISALVGFVFGIITFYFFTK
jgi:hypothetical protein